MFIKNTIETVRALDEKPLFAVYSSSFFQQPAKKKRERNNNPQLPRGPNNPGPGNEHASYLVLSQDEEASAINSTLPKFKGPVFYPF